MLNYVFGLFQGTYCQIEDLNANKGGDTKSGLSTAKLEDLLDVAVRIQTKHTTMACEGKYNTKKLQIVKIFIVANVSKL